MLKTFMDKWALSSRTMSLLTGKSEASIAKYKAGASMPPDVEQVIRELEKSLISIKKRHNREEGTRADRESGQKLELRYAYDEAGNIVFSGLIELEKQI